MKNFLKKVEPKVVNELLELALKYKSNPFAEKKLGKDKIIGLVFFNPSLRTRMSMQKASLHLGLHTIVLNVFQDGWGLETSDGTIMDGKSGEHIKEGVKVLNQYCDLIAIRSFAGLTDRNLDYEENVLQSFVKYSHCPIINMESTTVHPLQSLADKLTIQERSSVNKPKVVLTWAPHIKSLPQAVANSFIEWMNDGSCELVITHPPGYELAEQFTTGCHIEYDQHKALESADFVYCKNWSSYHQYGEILSGFDDWQMNMQKMKLTNQGKFMHCLPVRRNVVVADEVLDSSCSIVIEQAGNRVWAAQAVLGKILKGMSL